MTPAGPLLVDAHHLGLRATGNETWTRNVVRCLADLARPGEVEYAVTASGRAELSHWTASPVHLVAGSSTRRLLVDLPRVIRQAGAAAVLVTYTMPLTTCPAVVAIHDASPFHPEASSWLPRQTVARMRTTVGASARRAAHVLVLTETARLDVAKRLQVPLAQVTVAGAAVDADLAALLAAAERRPSEDGSGARRPFRVLAVGNVAPRKNLVLVARAVRAAREAGLPIELRVVGNVGERARDLAAEIQRQLGSSVSFSGYVTTAQLAGEYAAGDVLCMPSLHEGFGLPVIEAMAAGLPVVVSDRSALPEVAGDAGVVCPADDPRPWTAALTRLATDDAYRQGLCARGRRRSAEFSWTKTAEVVLDTLRVAARKP